jgi:hypothetical protein
MIPNGTNTRNTQQSLSADLGPSDYEHKVGTYTREKLQRMLAINIADVVKRHPKASAGWLKVYIV